ncbi:MAG TPA: hypothetical protein VJW20_11760 [Candidatus Angelobacter sp.]|nr:hypothetical protein [Candidatus Angelobacter sp.]
MKIVFCALSLTILCFAQNSIPKTNPPKLLLQILHCAKTDKFGLLDASLKDGVIKASWRHDRSSDPGVGEEFFIVLPGSRRGADVLVYVRKYKKGRVHFYLVNNATLSIEHGEVEVIDPLGGIWTHNHIKQNVRAALRGDQYSIPARGLLGQQFANVSCHSYSDPE